VLQKAVEYIYSLERERSNLRACNARLMRRLQSVLGHDSCDIDDDKDFSGAETVKRYKMDAESSDDGIGSMPSPLISDFSADVSVAMDSLHKRAIDLPRHQMTEQGHRSRGAVEERNSSSVNAATRCRDKTCSSSSVNVVPSRRGSLETIVEAIRCLEDDSKTSLNSGTGVCLSATGGALAKEEYVLCDVIAAAEALQFIAGRRQTSVNTSSSSPGASSWQRQKATLADACWRSCM
jgi:hypothetical protein